MVPRLQPALVAARDVPAATACAATALTASEQVFGIALVSDFFMLVTGIAGSCFYCKWERRSRSTMRCTLWVHVPSAMHFTVGPMCPLQCTLHPGSWHRLRQCPSMRAVDP